MGGSWQTLVTCAMGLSVALLTMWRGWRSPKAVPFGLLMLDMTAWNVATTFYEASGGTAPIWHFIDNAASPFCMPLALHFTLAFGGRVHSLRRILVASYVLAGLLSLVSLLALVWHPAAYFIDAHSWKLAIVLLGLVLLVGLPVLVVSLREARSADERARTVAVIAGMLVLAAGGASELLPGPGGLGAIPFLIFALLMLFALRRGLLEVQLGAWLMLPVSLAGGLAVGAWTVAYLSSNAASAATVLAVSVAALAAVILTTRLAADRREAKARMRQLAMLGSFSDQLAHNLRNPLAALKGAAQYLRGEVERGASLREQASFLDLLLQQVERLEHEVDDYRRLGRVEPVVIEIQINDVVRGVLAMQAFVDLGGVRISSDLTGSLPPLRADPDLLAQALENLLRNACEAMPGGGSITVTTGADGLDGVFVAVADEGEGMDARTRERVLYEAHTTRPGGTGLGLAFVQRVAEAHHGTFELSSRPSRGTTARMTLPAAPSTRGER